MNPIVLFTQYDLSRSFPSQCPQDGSVTFIDWYLDDTSSYLGPPPNCFPSICISVMASGVLSGSLVGLVIQPPDWGAVENIINLQDNQDQLQSIVRWGSHSSGQLNLNPNPQQFLLDCANDSNIPGDFGTIGLLNLLSNLTGDALKAQWAKSSSNFSSSVQSSIEEHALNNNMELQ